MSTQAASQSVRERVGDERSGPAEHPAPRKAARVSGALLLALGALVVLAVLLWQALAAAGAPDPTTAHSGAAAALDIGVLVFREGLESILVLAAITASMVGAAHRYRRPIALGGVVGIVATLFTWRVAVSIIDRLTESFPALQVQAATGLVAIVVLLVVMNWFFHDVYWTGWIGLHTKRKRELLRRDQVERASRLGVLWGLGLLGFSSIYREGFEVVLFLQTYRLRLGSGPVFRGVLVGVLMTGIIGVLTFVAQRRLPYKKMLVLTGALLGAVLLVMIGEQAQEMQLAHWLSTTPVAARIGHIPAWMGLWFAVFPTVETLLAQLVAALLVLGSYMIVRLRVRHAHRADAS